MRNKITIISLVALWLATAGAMAWLYLNPDHAISPQPTEKIVTRIDTVVVTKEVPKLVYRHLPAKTDTIYHTDTVHDTIYAWMKSDLDTSFTIEGVDYGHLYVSYWHPPFDYFDIDFIPAVIPERIITKTVTMPVTQKWYEKKEVWAGAAVLIGGIIAEARKK
jgi:hypothetical protein